MINNNHEMVTQQVMSPFADCRGNGMKFLDICRCPLKTRIEGLAKEGNQVGIL